MEILEDHVASVAEPGDEETLRLAVLQFSREVAFATAHVYASFAESRGAWDARLEALVVDALVRGRAVRGAGRPGGRPGLVGDEPGRSWWSAPRRRASTTRTPPSAGPRGRCAARCWSACTPTSWSSSSAGTRTCPRVAERVAEEFGPGPVVSGPVVDGLGRAGESAAAALAGLRRGPRLAGGARGR